MDSAQTLLLNQGFEPFKVISWQRAITLLFLGKVEVLEEYDHDVRSVNLVIKGSPEPRARTSRCATPSSAIRPLATSG